MKTVMICIALVAMFLSWSNISYAQPGNPFYDYFMTSYQNPSNASNANDLINLAGNIAGFLMIIGGVLAGIALIVSGLMYMTAGSNQTRVVAAKSIFKNGVIGALILFGFGIIINTVVLLATDPFNWFN